MVDRSTEAQQRIPSQPPSTAGQTLYEAAGLRVNELHGAVHAAEEAVPSAEDPRNQVAQTDTFLAVMSRHLAAVEDVVYPAVRNHLPDGRERAGERVHRAREAERAMRLLEGSMYGDTYAKPFTRAQLLSDLDHFIEEHGRSLRKFCEELDDRLPESDRVQLTESWSAAEQHAPTRPHPYSPHSPTLGRLSHKFWAVADEAMDSMDSRVIPHQQPPPRPERESLWSQWLTGNPQFDESSPAQPPQPEPD